MAETGQENRVLAALAYPIPLIGLFIIFSDLKKDAFVRYHGWQSVFWGVAWLVIYVVFSVLLSAFLFTLLGAFVIALFQLLWLAYLVLSLYFAYRTYQGDRFTIPVVSEYAQRYGKEPV